MPRTSDLPPRTGAPPVRWVTSIAGDAVDPLADEIVALSPGDQLRLPGAEGVEARGDHPQVLGLQPGGERAGQEEDPQPGPPRAIGSTAALGPAAAGETEAASAAAVLLERGFMVEAWYALLVDESGDQVDAEGLALTASGHELYDRLSLNH